MMPDSGELAPAPAACAGRCRAGSATSRLVGPARAASRRRSRRTPAKESSRSKPTRRRTSVAWSKSPSSSSVVAGGSGRPTERAAESARRARGPGRARRPRSAPPARGSASAGPASRGWSPGGSPAPARRWSAPRPRGRRGGPSECPAGPGRDSAGSSRGVSTGTSQRRSRLEVVPTMRRNGARASRRTGDPAGAVQHVPRRRRRRPVPTLPISAAGSTRMSRSSPMFAIARAAAPTFPSSRGRTSTTAGVEGASMGATLSSVPASLTARPPGR